MGGTVEEFRRKKEILERHCDEVGRDPAEITLSSHVRFDPAHGPAATAEAAFALAEAGAMLGIVQLPPPHDPRVLEPLAEALAALG